MSEELQSFYQQMQLEEEMHFYKCVNDVVDALSYHNRKQILLEVIKQVGPISSLVDEIEDEMILKAFEKKQLDQSYDFV